MTFLLYGIYHLKRSPTIGTYYGTKIKKRKQVSPRVIDSLNLPRHSSQGHPCC